MSTASCATTAAQVRFKGTVLTCTVLEVSQFDAVEFAREVSAHVASAPEFFRAVPFLLSLESHTGSLQGFPILELLGICADVSLHVIGVRAGSPEVEQLARSAGLPCLPVNASRERGERRPDAAAGAARPPEAVPSTARLIRQPVRSGQQVIAPDGDLIVMAPVSAGAEVLAAGNIHAYAPVRGRALAGIRGDTSARIFCQSLEAELVAIGGCYQVVEQTPDSGWRQAVVIELFDDKLTINPLPGARAEG